MRIIGILMMVLCASTGVLFLFSPGAKEAPKPASSDPLENVLARAHYSYTQAQGYFSAPGLTGLGAAGLGPYERVERDYREIKGAYDRIKGGTATQEDVEKLERFSKYIMKDTGSYMDAADSVTYAIWGICGVGFLLGLLLVRRSRRAS